MSTPPGGFGPPRIFKVAGIAAVAIGSLLVLYALSGVLERAFEHWSGPVQLAILAAAIVVVWLQRRHFAPRRPERDQVEAPSLAERVRRWRDEQDARVAEKICREVSVGHVSMAAAAADSLAQLDAMLSTRTAERARQQVLTERALAEVRRAAVDRWTELESGVAHVASICGTVIEHIEENRHQDEAVKSILALASNDRELSLVEEEAAEARAAVLTEPPHEILYRDNDQWVGGVAIIDLTGSNGTAHYWLRRESDGYIFPRSFAPDEVRITAVDALASRREPDVVLPR